MTLKTNQLAYHRNGICGAPFHVVTFDDEREGRMIGIVFEAEHHVAVLNLEKLDAGDVQFGSNSYRGDRYEYWLRDTIECYRAVADGLIAAASAAKAEG